MPTVAKLQGKCKMCGEPVISTNKTAQYCSTVCRSKAISIIRWGVRKIRPCQLCGQPIKKHNAKMYCSIQCRNTALSRRQPASTKPKPGKNDKRWWTPKQLEYLIQHYPADGADSVAQALGMTHKRVIQKANGIKLPLAPGVRSSIAKEINGERMRQSNPMHNPQAKAKMLKWWKDNPDKANDRSNNFLAGKQQSQKDKPNKLEIKAQAILESIGIEFEMFPLIKPKFIVDFGIGNTIIQIDGEYWHGHPRFEPLSERQKSQRKRDNAQDKYLMTCGYRVIRIWERDVTEENIRNVLVKHGLL